MHGKSFRMFSIPFSKKILKHQAKTAETHWEKAEEKLKIELVDLSKSCTSEWEKFSHVLDTILDTQSKAVPHRTEMQDGIII